MKKGERRKHELLELLADHILANGLQGASLRPLAAAAGTSDRMLLHYFADKEALLGAVLARIVERMIGLFSQIEGEAVPLQRLIGQLAQLINEPVIRPYLRIWLELIALAQDQPQPFQPIASQIASLFEAWIAARLAADEPATRAAQASFALALIEGLILFDAIGAGDKQAAVLTVLSQLAASPAQQ